MPRCARSADAAAPAARHVSVSRSPRLSWLTQPSLNLLFSQANDHEAAAPCPANPPDHAEDRLTTGHRPKCGCRTRALVGAEVRRETRPGVRGAPPGQHQRGSRSGGELVPSPAGALELRRPVGVRAAENQAGEIAGNL